MGSIFANEIFVFNVQICFFFIHHYIHRATRRQYLYTLHLYYKKYNATNYENQIIDVVSVVKYESGHFLTRKIIWLYLTSVSPSNNKYGIIS